MLSQIVHKLIRNLELEETLAVDRMERDDFKYAHAANNVSDAEYIDDASHFDDDAFIDGIDAGRGRKVTEFRDADVDVDAHSDGSSVYEKHAELGVGPVREASVPGALDYDSAHQDHHDSDRVKNALSLKEMWPHIRLLLEGYVLLWYLHPDSFMRKQLLELLQLVRHPVIISNIDPADGPSSICGCIRRFHSRHHKNDAYSAADSAMLNMGTNATTATTGSSSVSTTVGTVGTMGTTSTGTSESMALAAMGTTGADAALLATRAQKLDKQPYADSLLPHRHSFSGERYRQARQFPGELKRKSFEGLLNWVFLRSRASSSASSPTSSQAWRTTRAPSCTSATTSCS